MEFNDLAIVMRYSGERTYESLKKQLQYFVKRGACLETVTGNSFEKVLKSSYEAGLIQNRRATLIIDSDILLLTKRFAKCLKRDLKSIDFILGFSYRLIDKFYGAPKYRGIHIYNTKLLTKCLNEIPTEGVELRPESFVKKKIDIKWEKKIDIVGIHDFYQYNKHIFEKYIIRSHRSTMDISMLSNITKTKLSDDQYRIVRQSLEKGKTLNSSQLKNKRGVYLDLWNEIETSFEEKEIDFNFLLGVRILLIIYKRRIGSILAV